MDVVTLRLEPDLVEELEAEAEEKGFSNRTEYIRFLLRNRSEYAEGNGPSSGQNTSEYDSTLEELTERVERIEERLPELEPVEQWGDERRPQESHSLPPERSEPIDGRSLDPSENVQESEPQTREPDDTLAEDVRAYIVEEDLPPKSEHGRDAVIDVFRRLRENGSMGVGEIQEAVYPDYEEHWAGPRAMWNAIDRYLKDIPGIEKGGYGEWAYAGDDDVLERVDST